MFAELKECFMEAYDDNKDGKIEIREVSVISDERFGDLDNSKYSLIIVGTTSTSRRKLFAFVPFRQSFGI